MSTLYIAECALIYDTRPDNALPLADMPPVAEQTVSFTGTAGQSAALNVATQYVIVEADAACHLAFGTNPTATTSSTVRLAANTPKEFRVDSDHKISAIAQA